MSGSPEGKDQERWKPSNRLGKGSIDPALRESLQSLQVPANFRAVDPDLAIAELSRAVASFRALSDVHQIHMLPAIISAGQRDQILNNLTKFISGLHDDLAESLESAGIKLAEIIGIDEANSVKFSNDYKRVRFFTQAYLRDDREQYLAMTYDGKFEASPHPIAISFIGRLSEQGVNFLPFCAYSSRAFSELVNKKPLGPVLSEVLADGISSYVNQEHHDGLIDDTEYSAIDTMSLAIKAKREAFGVFKVHILGNQYRFRLALGEELQLKCSFIEQVDTTG